MLDVKGAGMAVAKLIAAGSTVSNALPMVPKKMSWANQNIGTYDLLFPYIHDNFPTREEVIACVLKAINKHNTTNKHNGDPGSPGIPSAVMLERVNMELVIGGGMKVRPASPINAIGYGV